MINKIFGMRALVLAICFDMTFSESLCSSLGRDILYQARLSIYDQNPLDALTYWFRYQSLPGTLKEDIYSKDFDSILWFLSEHLDFCPDDLKNDAFGIYFLSAHNSFVDQKKSFNNKVSFLSDVGMLKKSAHVHSFLSVHDFKSLRLVKQSCDYQHLNIFKPKRFIKDKNMLLALSMKRALEDFVSYKPDFPGIETVLSRIELITSYQNKYDEEFFDVNFYLNQKPSFWLKQSLMDQKFILTNLKKKIDPSLFKQFIYKSVGFLLSKSAISSAHLWLGEVYFIEDKQDFFWSNSLAEDIIRYDDKSASYVYLKKSLDDFYANKQEEALNHLSFALQKSSSSFDKKQIEDLAQRLIKKYCERFKLNDRVLILIDQFFQKHQRSDILFDLIWTSYLIKDSASIFFIEKKELEKHLSRRNYQINLVLRDFFKKENGLSYHKDHIVFEFAKIYLQKVSEMDFDIQKNLFYKSRYLKNFILDQSDKSKSNKKRFEGLLFELENLLALWKEKTTEKQRIDGVHHKKPIFLGAFSIETPFLIPWPYPKFPESYPAIFTKILYQPFEVVKEDGTIMLGWKIE